MKEKTINEFLKDMKLAGFDFEFKATRESDGLQIASKGWREPVVNLKEFDAKPSPGFVMKK